MPWAFSALLVLCGDLLSTLCDEKGGAWKFRVPSVSQIQFSSCKTNIFGVTGNISRWLACFKSQHLSSLVCAGFVGGCALHPAQGTRSADELLADR